MTDALSWRNKSTLLRLSAIMAVAVVFRLALLSLVHNPGLHDPLHYFNLGRRLSQGQGFTIDYVWHYSRMPSEITHGIDHWMPLAGVASAAGIALGGQSPQAAALAFIVAGTLIPLLAFFAGKQLHLADDAALFAAALAALLPDFVLTSLRTDTTTLNAVFICAAILLLNNGLNGGRLRYFALCGALAGLAYLTRNDAILFLPLLLSVIALRMWMGEPRLQTRAALTAACLCLAAFLVVIAPWLGRNRREMGRLGIAETDRMFFMVEQADHYAYGIPITRESMLQRQNLNQLVYRRLFELAAATKQIAVSLTFPIIVLVPTGLIWVVRKRDRSRLLAIAPPLSWLLGILIVYPLLLPLKSQAGSFEKAFLTITPLLIPLAALAIDTLITRTAVKRGFVAITLLWLGYSSATYVQQETEQADIYYDSIQVLVETLETLPDITGDSDVRLMSQDPFVLSFFGYSSVMTPLASREDTLELARQFEIDYLLMPAGRPALDPLYLGEEIDPRFELVAHLADAGEIPFELYRLVYQS